MAEKRFPEYEPDALFRCNMGCGTERRDRLGTFRGQLFCKRCGWRWTLTYVPRAAEEKRHGC